MSGPVLVGLSVADPVSAWSELGFFAAGETVWLEGLTIQLGGPGVGITGWCVWPDPGDVDGLPRCEVPHARPAVAVAHANGAVALDHVVVTTPDFERTGAALAAAGMEFRRVRAVPASGDRPAFRQGFRRLGATILEVVEAVGAPSGPATFWGLVVIVTDLGGLAERLGPERLGAIRPAVQPGRQIATLRRAAGLSLPLAFMDPEP